MSASAGPLQVGDLLAGRYLLLEVVADDGPAVLWRANDEILARAVAVKVLATPNQAARDEAQPFLEAAVRTCSVNHPGLARVYDATLERRPGRGNDVAYVISEWVDGESLDVHLTEVGALSPADAADVLRQAADALTAAHAGGLLHGRLHPRNVLVTSSGRVRLTDAAVAAALHGEPVAAVADQAGVRTDTRDLAGLLYALLTARWPEDVIGLAGGSLPPAPTSDGHLLSARQVRAGVPRALDTVVARGLNPTRSGTHPPLVTPAALADAADASAAEYRQVAPTAPAQRSTTSLRQRWRPWMTVTSLVLATAVTGWFWGLQLGELPRDETAVDAIVSPTVAPAPDSKPVKAIDLAVVPVRDFDPAGDGQENPDQVRNAVDGFANTAWSTTRYRSARFGGTKGGVGLLLDLGSTRPVRSVEVGFTAKGAEVELRAGTSPPPRTAGGADTLRTVAASLEGDQVAKLVPAGGVRARYLLVWITTLPQDEEGWRVGISELRVA